MSSADRLHTSNDITSKARWMPDIILRREGKAEALQEEAKEAEVKAEAEVDRKEARTSRVTAEEAPKDKGKVKKLVEGRAIAIGNPPKEAKNQEVSRLLIT